MTKSLIYIPHLQISELLYEVSVKPGIKQAADEYVKKLTQAILQLPANIDKEVKMGRAVSVVR